MERPNRAYPRLLKVVFPSSYFARLILRRAPQMKPYPYQTGIFIEPSLPKAVRNKESFAQYS